MEAQSLDVIINRLPMREKPFTKHDVDIFTAEARLRTLKLVGGVVSAVLALDIIHKNYVYAYTSATVWQGIGSQLVAFLILCLATIFLCKVGHRFTATQVKLLANGFYVIAILTYVLFTVGSASFPHSWETFHDYCARGLDDQHIEYCDKRELRMVNESRVSHADLRLNYNCWADTSIQIRGLMSMHEFYELMVCAASCSIVALMPISASIVFVTQFIASTVLIACYSYWGLTGLDSQDWRLTGQIAMLAFLPRVLLGFGCTAFAMHQERFLEIIIKEHARAEELMQSRAVGFLGCFKENDEIYRHFRHHDAENPLLPSRSPGASPPSRTHASEPTQLLWVSETSSDGSDSVTNLPEDAESAEETFIEASPSFQAEAEASPEKLCPKDSFCLGECAKQCHIPDSRREHYKMCYKKEKEKENAWSKRHPKGSSFSHDRAAQAKLYPNDVVPANPSYCSNEPDHVCSNAVESNGLSQFGSNEPDHVCSSAVESAISSCLNEADQGCSSDSALSDGPVQSSDRSSSAEESEDVMVGPHTPGTEGSHEVSLAEFARIPRHPVTGELLSKGSAEHASGNCRPCEWLQRGRLCRFGWRCPFCHLLEDHKTYVRPRGRKDKKDSSSIPCTGPNHEPKPTSEELKLSKKAYL